MLSKQQLQSVMSKITAENLEKYTEPLSHAMERYQINTPLRIAAFLAQLAHESNHLKYSVENLNYSAERLLKIFPKYFTAETAKLYERQPEKIANKVYANRMGNGDEASSEGYRFRGRGPLQCTGKDNYATLTKEIGVDFVANPELLEGPVYGALSAGAFWSRNKINEIADTGDVEKVTKRVNGGINGLEERREYYKTALQVFAP